jgi:hypothetical protein
MNNFILREDVQEILKSSIPLISKNINEGFGEGFFGRLGLAAQQFGSNIKGNLMSAYADAAIDHQQRLTDFHKKYVMSAVSQKTGLPEKQIHTMLNYYPSVPIPHPGQNASVSKIEAWNDYMEKYHRRNILQNTVNYTIRKDPTLAHIHNVVKGSPSAPGVVSNISNVVNDISSKLSSPDPNVNPFRAAARARNARTTLKNWRRAKAASEYQNLHPWIKGLLTGIETVV